MATRVEVDSHIKEAWEATVILKMLSVDIVSPLIVIFVEHQTNKY